MGVKKNLILELPQQRMIGFTPLIVAIVISAVDIVFVFLDNIISAVKSKNATVLIGDKGVLSGTAFAFQLTWGVVITICLNFVENTLKWSLNRKKYNLFGTLNAAISTIFIMVIAYTMLWANDGAGMTFICKSFLVLVGIKDTPDMIKAKIYSPEIKYYIDLAVCWVLPIQCGLVMVDCILCMCRKGKK